MATHGKRRKRQGPAGFTLIELMVVIVIIGLLVALVGPQLIGAADDAKVVAEGEFTGLSCCGDPDWYKLDLNQGDGLDILIEFTNSAGDLDLWVFEPSVFDQPSLSCENAVACSTTENDGEEVSIPAVPLTTTYYIAVGPYQGAKNSYIMTILVTPVQQGCQDDDDEQNDLPASNTAQGEKVPV